MSKLLMRTPFDGLSDEFSEQTSVFFPPAEEEEFSALQSFRDECDINNIVARMETDQYDRFHERVNSGVYLDLASMPEFQGAMNVMNEAQAAFADLPAKLRRDFDNDPALFLDFVQNAERGDLEKYGLLNEPLHKLSSPENQSVPPEGGQDDA
jgi:hypothetical protein